MRRRVPPALAVLLVLLSCLPARAGAPTEELRGFFGAASRILEDPETEGGHEERLRRIRIITRQMFDFREAAKLSLGPTWQDRTPAEQDEFVRLYGDLLERAFIAWVAARAQVAGGIKISFLGESVDGGLATVRTSVLGRSGQELPFDYRLIERGDGWAVRDVAIDGVSLTANFRAQFSRVIQSSSYPELVRQLQDKVPAPAVMTAAADERAPAPAIPPPVPAGRGAEPAVAAPIQIAGPRPHLELHVSPVAPTPVRSAASPFVAARSEVVDQSHGSVLAPREITWLQVTPPPVSGFIHKPSVEPPARVDGRLDPGGLNGIAPARVVPSRPAEAEAPTGRSYWVQVAAFKSLEAAMRLVSLLRGERPAPPDRWAVVMEPPPALARVRVGPFADREEAASSLRALQARGFKPFIAEERD